MGSFTLRGAFPVLSRMIATVGGIGYFPRMPGTIGSAAGVVIYWLLSQGGEFIPLAGFLLISVAAVWSSGIYERRTGRSDPQEVVVDEVAGQILCLLASSPSPVSLLVGFLVFRFFDVWKPCRWLEDLPGGWGIVADDIAAGFLGGCVLALGRFAGYL